MRPYFNSRARTAPIVHATPPTPAARAPRRRRRGACRPRPRTTTRRFSGAAAPCGARCARAHLLLRRERAPLAAFDRRSPAETVLLLPPGTGIPLNVLTDNGF